MANIGTKNATDYQYSLYADYLDQVNGILTKYGQQSGLSIEYWHIRVDESKNYDDLRIQNAYKHYVYDLYHFVPTINMTPLTYQVGYSQQHQGTSNIATGSMSLYLLDKPLPGDVFRFYPYGGITDRTEIFRITNVRYMRTSNDKLSLYQLDFETAPMLVGTLEHVRINEIMCWDTENYKFVDEAHCNNLECMQKCRDKLVDYINRWYDEQKGWYGLCREGGNTHIDWDTLCIKSDPKVIKDINTEDDCPGGPEVPQWPPGPGWPGWDDSLLDSDSNSDVGGSCGSNSDGKTTRPLVFLNTILKRIKKIYNTVDLQPIYGIGTAKIPIEWILPTYEVQDPDNPETPIIMQRDYWDTFTCLSYQPEAAAGELMNITKILNGDCTECPPELVEEINCHRELYVLVMALVTVLKNMLTEEQLKDNGCDRKCCDMFDPNFIGKCIGLASSDSGSDTFDNLFWDASGKGAGANAINPFCGGYNNTVSLCGVPLFLSWKDGAVWPDGSKSQGGTQ